jgi:hypothetical protein
VLYLQGTYHDGGFPNSRRANEGRIIFSPSAENLDCSADFIVSAYHGVELPLSCKIGQVNRIFFQSFAGGGFLISEVEAEVSGIVVGGSGIVTEEYTKSW